MNLKRVVVTGMGVVSPIGNNLTAFRANLREGVCGMGPITCFDTDAAGGAGCAGKFPVQNVFEVKSFDPHSFGTQLLDPFIQYAVAATDEALRVAKLDTKQVDSYRIGIAMSSSKGGVHTIDRFKERFSKHPSAILGARIYANSVPNFAAQWIARRWELNGPAKCYVAACATGTVAVIEGARMVAEGTVDYCIAGSSDASVTPLMLAGYRSMKALAKDRILPFDKRRSGFVVGEGAGALVLETLENAQGRGAKIYGEILGHAYACDAHHPVQFNPNGDSLAYAIRLLLKRTNLSAKEMQYINLHGTATQVGDIYETDQIKKAFGREAYSIPMSSTKAMMGHMLGAAGSVEIISALLAMEDGFIPPTIGLEKPDPKCDLDYTPNRAKEAKVEHALSLSLGFGGHIALIALGKVS